MYRCLMSFQGIIMLHIVLCYNDPYIVTNLYCYYISMAPVIVNRAHVVILNFRLSYVAMLNLRGWRPHTWQAGGNSVYFITPSLYHPLVTQ